MPHESKPGLWKIYGRSDDQIMLSTGEKVRPFDQTPESLPDVSYIWDRPILALWVRCIYSNGKDSIAELSASQRR